MNNLSWKTLPSDKAVEEKISNALEISPITAGLLLNRGIREPNEAEYFLSPSIESMHDPFLMKDMEKAVSLIRNAVKNGRKILVYGDYDADGITSAALLLRVLRDNGASADFYIPHRINDGYGLNESAVESAREKGAELIITVDCGINSIKEVILAQRLGIDVVITDHHEISCLALPPARAVINPLQSGCKYPYKKLSGAGVAFKLAWALFGKAGAMRHLDLAAVGTVADVCPLTGENRAIVKFGIEALAGTKKPGLSALLECSGIKDRDISARDIAFIIAPRLNAPGRIASAASSVELLLSEDPAGARERAAALEQDNKRRQKIQKEIFDSASSKLAKNGGGPLIALADDRWHPGLIGIIASKICEQYSRPAVLISSDGDSGRGSARSGDGFHILSALSECRSLLSDLGGHANAAGFSIKKRNIPKFLEKIRDIALNSENCADDDLLTADRKISLREISAKLLEEFNGLQPFGEGNPEPLFTSEEVSFSQIRCLKNSHLKMKASQDGRSFDCIGFGMYDEHTAKEPSGRILFTPGINLWKGRRSIQLVLKGVSGCG